MSDKRKTYDNFKNEFLGNQKLSLGRSRRYDVIAGRSIIDGFNAIEFFKISGIDYRAIPKLIRHKAYQFSRHSHELYDFEIQKYLMSINIRNFADCIHTSIDDFLMMVGVNPVKGKIILGRGDALPLGACLELERKIGLSLPLWFSRTIDFKAAAANWKMAERKKLHLPKHYIIRHGSKVRTFESAINFVQQHLGLSVVKDIMLRMQIHRDIFYYPDKDISLKAFNDLCKFLRIYGCDDDFFVAMGEHNPYSNIISKIDFRQRFSPSSTFDVLKNLTVNLIPRIDRNYDYDIDIVNSKHIRISTHPKSSMVKQMNTTVIGSRDVALYQLGHIGSMSIYFDLPPASAKSYMNYNEETDETVFNYLF